MVFYYNQPIGIPSGWEIRAAGVAISQPLYDPPEFSEEDKYRFFLSEQNLEKFSPDLCLETWSPEYRKKLFGDFRVL